MPFIFTWTAVLFIPLIMSTGVIGLVSYLGYLWPNMSQLEIYLVSLAIVGVVLFALYRRIESISFLTRILFAVMLLSIGMVGEYVAKIYAESKRRPRYFIDRTI